MEPNKIIKTLSLYLGFVGLVTLAVAFPPTPANTDSAPRVVVNAKANTADSISIRELIDIFTRRKTKWDDRTEIVVITQEMNSIPNDNFLIQVLGVTPYQYRSRLSRNTYSGRTLPPIEVSSEEEMLDRLLANESSIGYLYNYILYKDDERLVIVNVTD